MKDVIIYSVHGAFYDCDPLVAETSLARFSITGDALTIDRIGPGVSQEEIDDFLRAWELESELIRGFSVIRFHPAIDTKRARLSDL